MLRVRPRPSGSFQPDAPQSAWLRPRLTTVQSARCAYVIACRLSTSNPLLQYASHVFCCTFSKSPGLCQLRHGTTVLSLCKSLYQSLVKSNSAASCEMAPLSYPFVKALTKASPKATALLGCCAVMSSLSTVTLGIIGKASFMTAPFSRRVSSACTCCQLVCVYTFEYCCASAHVRG